MNAKKKRYKVVTLLSILIALLAIVVVWKRRGICCSLPRCDELKCMRKKKTRYETKQINTHPTNERSLFEGSGVRAEWDRRANSVQYAAERTATTSTETGNEAVQTAKTAVRVELGSKGA